MDACNESADRIWACQLYRGNESHWIVWTTDNAQKTFAVPTSWRAPVCTPLLGELYAVKGSNIPISQVPVLPGVREQAIRRNSENRLKSAQ